MFSSYMGLIFLHSYLYDYLSVMLFNAKLSEPQTSEL